MWVVLALVILIALTALVLSVPVDLKGHLEVHGGAVGFFRFEWLFGRMSKESRTGMGAPAEEKPPRSEKKRAKKKEGKEKGGAKSVRSGVRLASQLLTTPGLLRGVVRLLRRLLQCIRLRWLSADFSLDLGDPADTALYVGSLSQAAMLADLWFPYPVRLMPAFTGDPMVEGEGNLWIRLRPISLLPPVLAFIFAPSTLRAIVRLIRWRTTRSG